MLLLCSLGFGLANRANDLLVELPIILNFSGKCLVELGEHRYVARGTLDFKQCKSVGIRGMPGETVIKMATEFVGRDAQLVRIEHAVKFAMTNLVLIGTGEGSGTRNKLIRIHAESFAF